MTSTWLTLVRDGCTTESAERHDQSLLGIRGYCRQRTTDLLLGRLRRSLRRVDRAPIDRSRGSRRDGGQRAATGTSPTRHSWSTFREEYDIGKDQI